jgi:glucosamine-6-phosphate deaminase
MVSTPSSITTAAGFLFVYPDRASACRSAADRIASAVRAAVVARGRGVLGLATGGTPIPVYERLVQLTRSRELTWTETSTYNLDEFYPISPLDPRSYRAYMHRHLFSDVDLPPNRTHLLDGTVPEPFVAAHCAEFERWIEADGGLDLQLLGIGRNGHIGFNEPCELPVDAFLKLRTRLMPLHAVTRADSAHDFGGSPELVPPRALTMGVATILSARSILILAFGSAKAEAVARAIEGPITASLPASVLQTVADRVTWLVDEPAAAGLASAN